jgi:riboflavin kinase/FMN adenylyltransferase
MTPNELGGMKKMDAKQTAGGESGVRTRSEKNPCEKKPSDVALGMFDGVHIGHQALVKQAVSIARNHGWCSVVYTFENHPRSVFGQAPSLLMDVATRRAALYALGADRVDMVKFTRTLAEKTPRAFLKLLTSRYDVRAVVAGKDFTFGHKGTGNTEALRALGAEMGFEVCEMPVVLLDGDKVSSTRIRAALQDGDEDLAARMLGH